MESGPQQPSPSLRGLADSLTPVWTELIQRVAPCLQELFKLSAPELEALRDNKEGCAPCCVLEYAVDACALVFVSRGFEEKTGYSAEQSLGKGLDLLEIKAKGLNKFINHHELDYIYEFCRLGHDAVPNASIVSLVLHEREQGDRFWNILRMQYVTLEGKLYIFCVNAVLDLPLPTVIREARFLPDAQLDEAQFSCFLDALLPFLDQLRPQVRKQVSDDMTDLQDMVLRSILSFMKSNTSEFEGDHWVPLLGQDKTYAFQQDVKWTGILAKVQNSLFKIWEVSERHDEVVACAVSDPTGDDCPLVYISREFEKLTGYQREWVLGRNCRFLQPNHCWRNSAFNKEECRRMREFCREPMAEHSRIVNLLVNERKDGYPFWNLLVMEHIEVPVNPKTSLGGVDRRCYIFGVQTNLYFQLHRLTEMLAMDTRGLIELKRLRELFQQQEYSLRTQSLHSFAQDVIALWACDFPAALELPRIQMSSQRGRAKASMPVVGLELNAHNVIQTMPAAIQEGLRHFYLTFPPSEQGEILDARMGELEVKLLSLRLAQGLAGLSRNFLHYLREAVTFTVVSPPALVKFFGEIAKSVNAHGYKICSWLLDVRGADSKHSSTPKALECWQVMAEAWRSGEVQSLGLCGAGKDLFEALIRVPNGPPVAAFGIEVFPGKPALDCKFLHKSENAQRNGRIATIAFNVFGPKQGLLDLEGLKDEAEHHNTDVAMLLTKWCSSQVDAMMIPATSSGEGRPSRPQRRKSAADFRAGIDVGQVSQSSSGASMMPEEPSKVEANVHRSFIKAFNAMSPVDGLEYLVAAALEPRHAEAIGNSRRRSSTLTHPSLTGAGHRRGSGAATAMAQALPPVSPGGRRTSVSRTSTATSDLASAPRAFARSSTFEVRLPTAATPRGGSKTSAAGRTLLAAAGLAASTPRATPRDGARRSISHQPSRAAQAQLSASDFSSEPLAPPSATPVTPAAQLCQAQPSEGDGPGQAEVAVGGPPSPPSAGPPADRFRRSYRKRAETQGSDVGEDSGADFRHRFHSEPADSMTCSTVDSACGHGSAALPRGSYNARIVAKLVSKGMDISDIADTLDIDVGEVRMLMNESCAAGA